MTLPAWVGDRLVASAGADAVVSVHDAGLRSGLGVFETLRAHGTATLAADRHLARLAVGATRLDIPLDVVDVAAALDAVLAAPRDVHEVVVRITVTAGPVDPDSDWPPAPSGRPTLVVTLHPAPTLPRPPGRAVTTHGRRWPADVKSTSYVASLLATREARAAGADIAVLVDGDELLETAEGNLFAIVDGTLVTPPDDGRLLPGITRGVVLEAAAELAIPTATVPLRRADARRAEAFAASSSVAGLRTILRIDDMTPMITDREHPVIVALRDRLAALRS